MNRLSSVLIALPLFAAAASAQMYPATWKLAHPDAKALIGLDVRSVRESEAAQAFGSDFEKGGMGMFPPPGLELLKAIDQVFISSPGGKTGSQKENPPVLIVLTGRFTRDQLRQFFPKPNHSYGLVDIYGSSEHGDLSIALLDEHTLVLGDEASLRGAIDRSSQRPRAPSALLARASAMAADNDFWLIATVPPSAFQPANVNLGPFATAIQAVDTGFSLHDGFRFELGLTTKTPEMAQEMARMLLEQVKAGLASNPHVLQGADIIQKLQVSSEGTRMGVKIALNREEVAEAIRTAKAARQTASVPKLSPLPTQRPSPVQPADDKPKTIKILGLDDGVREIPFGPNARN